MTRQELRTKVFLLGFMGSGKTTLGRLLADRLGWTFHDLDEIVEQDERSTITRLFAEKGEDYFRAAEARVLARLCALPGPAVIACGGGTYCSVPNQQAIDEAGITVWLDQPFAAIWKRREALAHARPLMSGEADLAALYDRRLPFYRAAALHLPIGEGQLPEALDELTRLLEARCGIVAP